MYQDLALLAMFILVYRSVVGAVERTRVGGPILFTAFGLLIGLPLTILRDETNQTKNQIDRSMNSQGDPNV